MSKPRRNSPVLPLGDPLFAPKQRKVVPHEFVLDAIAPLLPWTRPMFGCLAVYVEDKIVLILRDKRDETADNGVWLATTEEYHEVCDASFRICDPYRYSERRSPAGRSSADAPDFEEAVLLACELLVARDPRIGKVPGARRPSGSGAKKAPKSFMRAKGPKKGAKGQARS